MLADFDPISTDSAEDAPSKGLGIGQSSRMRRFAAAGDRFLAYLRGLIGMAEKPQDDREDRHCRRLRILPI
jgi:hypothetical protein